MKGHQQILYIYTIFKSFSYFLSSWELERNEKKLRVTLKVTGLFIHHKSYRFIENSRLKNWCLTWISCQRYNLLAMIKWQTGDKILGQNDLFFGDINCYEPTSNFPNISSNPLPQTKLMFSLLVLYKASSCKFPP